MINLFGFYILEQQNTRTTESINKSLIGYKMPTTANNISAHQYLITLLASTQDTTKVDELLNALLTDKELQELNNRLRIFALLQQGKPQREISETLGVGIATVSRGAKAYQQHNINQLLPNIGNELND